MAMSRTLQSVRSSAVYFCWKTNNLFDEPALELSDIIRTDADGRGVINLLAADQLMSSPGLYATFLLWLLS